MVEWTRIIATREIGDDDKGKVKGQVVYLVKCSEKSDGPEVAAASTPGPLWPYTGNSAYLKGAAGLVCTNRDCREKELTADGGTIYEVTLNFDTLSHDPDQSSKNPLERKRICKLSFDSVEEPVFKAPNVPTLINAAGQKPQNFNVGGGNAVWPWQNGVHNSAKQPFDPTVTEIFRDPVFTIQLNMAELPWNVVLGFSNAVNTDQFDIEYRGNVYTVGIGKGWLYEINSEPRYENGVAYEEVSVVLKLRNDGWKRNILDQGMEQLYNGDLPPRPIRDKNGDPVRMPALLDGMGSALGKARPPVFIVYDFKNHKRFGDLPFWKD